MDLERWRRALAALDSIREVYTGPVAGVGNEEVDRRVNLFFDECNAMREWLNGDIASLPGLSESQVDAHALETTALARCNAVASTDKHHTRSSGVTARIQFTDMTANGARVTLAFQPRGGTPYTEDALDLAQRCVSSWRQFLAQHKIVAP